MSTSVLKALPGKLDIKRHSPSILYFFVEVINIRTYDLKTSKWQNVNTIEGGARNISIKKWLINYFKIKIILLIINFRCKYDNM